MTCEKREFDHPGNACKILNKMVIELTFVAQGKAKGYQRHSTQVQSDEKDLKPEDIFPYMDDWFKEWCVVKNLEWVKYVIKFDGIEVYHDFRPI